MKKTFALAAILAGFGAAGCTGTTPGRQWAADPDKPPPLASNIRSTTGATEVEPVKLAPAHTRVSADEIDENNYQDMLRRLQGEQNVEKRALSQAK